MKKIKKIVKSILCGLMAVGCLLSSTLPAYAADIGCSVSYANSFNEDGTPKSYVGYDPSNAFSFYAITFLGNSDGYHFLVGQLTDNLNDLTSLKTTTHFVDPKKDDVVLEKQYSAKAVTVLDFLKKTYNSQGATGATLYDLSVTKILENPNYSNYTKEFIEKALSSYYFACNYKNYGFNIGDSKYEFSAQKKWSIMDFVFYLLNCYEKGIRPGEDQQDTDYLPMLDYKISKKFGLQPANDFIKYNIHVNWDHTKKLPYSEELSRYNVEVRAVLNLEDLGNSSKCKRVTLENTTSDHLSFGSDDVAELLGSSPADNLGFTGYIYNICIRTCDKNSSKVSYWKTWVVTSTGAGKNPDITPGTKYYDKDGNVVKGNDGNDIDRTPSDDNIDNSGYVKDPDGTSNTAKKDPNSDLYEDADGKVSATGTLSSIKQIILSLGDVPKLLALCLTWLPSSFTTLIGAALSMIVIIGVIRWLK